MKYRLQAQGLTKTIQKWVPPKKKKNGTMTVGRWVNWKYYGNWRDAISHCLLNAELYPIGAELKEQLENFPQSLEKATQKVIDSLELGDRI